MSEKPVAERLQVKLGRTLHVRGASAPVDTAILEGDARGDLTAADIVLTFVNNRAALEAELTMLLNTIRADAILWIAYPKLTSSLAGDLSRDIIHKLAPNFGLNTVSQIAIDADWSAMRMKRALLRLYR
jgi:hypothetical protein